MTRAPHPLDDLWGSVVLDYALDFAEHTFSMNAVVFGSDEVTRYAVRFYGVRQFEYGDATAGRWNYVELTSLKATSFQEGTHTLWSVTLELWQSTLQITCEGMTVNGVEVRSGTS